jgi:uncharacterized metal-binding protein
MTTQTNQVTKGIKVKKRKREIMEKSSMTFSVEVEETRAKCPKGEETGKQNQEQGKIPVLSCEGACIRGEIARLAANMVAKEESYRRGCHGELITVPHSAISQWTRDADKVVLIDGCFLRCHGRMLRNIVGKDRLAEFDALSHYKKYTDIFDIDDVPEEERITVARDVADWVISVMEKKEV